MNELLKNLIVENLVVLVAVLGLAFVAIIGLLGWQIWNLTRRLNRIFGARGAKDLEEVIASEIKASRKMQKDIKQLFNETEYIRGMAIKSIQKVGVIRFNPFKDSGGDQSFSIAFLDSEDNGLVISSLHARQETRVYSKPIKAGKCEKYQLTEEEEQAIKQAKGS